ncbi:enoyl-CoA hydratase-related protein [Peterkaempfera bronchialis]|uniref:Enoyl-CoA hydratase n=1 Tax=Peterkaempfera bronchialis TaxID=2126346 RepID=A0A345SR07_9ACTN|nr:enoyl-CoA hydratase-related protein [Peterkaempfera bronchialis]AXI76162.1 enoyl-CoA hydratase [Peterkaempfera bronchialis]
MEPQHLRIDRDDRTGVVVVTLDQPPVNALDERSYAELTHVFDSFGHDRTTRAVVLAAAGRVFCAGGDIRATERRLAGGGDAGPRHQLDPGLAPRACLTAIRTCPVPVVAAVGGAAVGAGLAMVSQCDVILASSAARFGMTEINVGVLGGYTHLQRLVGPYKARAMYFTGELVEAAEMYRFGAIAEVTSPDELAVRARDVAEAIAAKSPVAVRLAKEAILRSEHLPVDQAYPIEQEYTARLSRFDDSAEARAAFLEKREPVFRWQ